MDVVEREHLEELWKVTTGRKLTHCCHIFEMNGESYRSRESMKTQGDKACKTLKPKKS